MDFHQIFRICLAQEDLELIRFWEYLALDVAKIGNILRLFCLKLCNYKGDTIKLYVTVVAVIYVYQC